MGFLQRSRYTQSSQSWPQLLFTSLVSPAPPGQPHPGALPRASSHHTPSSALPLPGAPGCILRALILGPVSTQDNQFPWERKLRHRDRPARQDLASARVSPGGLTTPSMSAQLGLPYPKCAGTGWHCSGSSKPGLASGPGGVPAALPGPGGGGNLSPAHQPRDPF